MAEQKLTSLPDKVSRLFAPDALRGLIMVFMALDHANLFVAHKHPPGELWGGPFPAYYDTLTFLTRFVTHFSAPGFFLLMGVGMALMAQSNLRKGWSKGAVTRHLMIRGALLIALQLLVVNRAWELSPGGWGIQIYIGVLFALGANMILGSLLLWLKPAYLLGVTALLVLGTELAVPPPSAWGPGLGLPRYVLLIPGGIVSPEGQTLLWSYYPVLPWLELVTLGMVFGYWLNDNPRLAFEGAAKVGLAFLAGFVVIRYLDGFGNTRPRVGDTWIDFLNPVKYPPSIAFTAMTTGVNLLVLWALGRLGESAQRLLRPLTLLGRAPLLFYVLHLFLYAALGRWFAPQGTSIPAMYLFWLIGVLILLPVCAWYGARKQRQPASSVLRYL